MIISYFKNVFKNYKDPHNDYLSIPVLKNISWEIPKGSFTSITGKSGSGKSTLFNLLGGLDRPTKGEVISCGYPLHKIDEEKISFYRNRKIGLVFQQHYLLKDFSVLENVFIPSLISQNFNKKRAKELLEIVGLKERMHHYPYQLSGGEAQRACLARSLINQPEIILADEPTGNLDEQNAQLVQELLISLKKTFNTTLIVVTHDKSWALQADFCYNIENFDLNLYEK